MTRTTSIAKHVAVISPRLHVRSERVEQAHIVQLARTLGASVYVLGTTRPRADSHHGTCQTPGLPDLYLLWGPVQRRETDGYNRILSGCGLWWEVKRAGAKRTRQQVAFAMWCLMSDVPYGWGDCDEFIRWCRAHGRLRGEIGRTA